MALVRGLSCKEEPSLEKSTKYITAMNSKHRETQMCRQIFLEYQRFSKSSWTNTCFVTFYSPMAVGTPVWLLFDSRWNRISRFSAILILTLYWNGQPSVLPWEICLQFQLFKHLHFSQSLDHQFWLALLWSGNIGTKKLSKKSQATCCHLNTNWSRPEHLDLSCQF